MTKAQIKDRLETIDDHIEKLQEEREGLESTQRVLDKWTPTATEKKLRAKVLAHFGPNHPIKLAIFKANSEYNDEGYSHNARLILIDDKFNEVEHKLSTDDLVPDDDEQDEYYEVMDSDLQVDDVTVHF